MLTDAALNRMLRSLGAERRRVEQEIRRLEKLAEQTDHRGTPNGVGTAPTQTRSCHPSSQRS